MKNSHKGFSYPVKNNNFLSLSLMCLVFISGFMISACENADVEYIDGPVSEIKIFEFDDPVLTTSKLELNHTPFKFSLSINHCIAGGVGASVSIENPEEYSFLWEVNDNPGGHDISTLPCLCGGDARVTIMRRKDGVKLSKSIALPPCAGENE